MGQINPIELPNVIAINIVNFEHIPIEDFHTTFHLWEDIHKDFMLTDALEIHFVNMVKFKRLKDKDIKNNSLHRWLTFFDRDAPEDMLREVIEMEDAIKKVKEKIDYLASNEDALRLYEMREMGLSDYTSGMNYARQEGEKTEREKWQGVVADKDAEIAEQATEIERLRAQLKKD